MVFVEAATRKQAEAEIKRLRDENPVSELSLLTKSAQVPSFLDQGGGR